MHRRTLLVGLALSLALPSTALAAKKKATKAPKTAGTLAAGIGLSPGTAVPALEAQDLTGQTVALDTLFAEGPTLLVFYRGGWCPYCNHQLYSLAGAHPDFAEAGVRIAVISVDTPDQASLTHAEWTLPFPALSDSGLAVHEAFQVVFQLDEKTQAKYAQWGLDLEGHSGRTDGKIAVPAMFLVKDGKVAWAHTDPDYKVRPSPEQVLAALKRAGHAG